MSEMLKKMQELELKASKFDDLKEIFDTQIKKIFELTQQIQKEIKDINPTFEVKVYKERRSYGDRDQRANQLYNLLKEDDSMQITLSDIESKFDLSSGAAQVPSIHLRKMNGIMTRLDGKKLYIYYHKPKIGKDETEISPETKIPTKVSFMR